MRYVFSSLLVMLLMPGHSALAQPIVFELDTGVSQQNVTLATDFMEWSQWPMTEDRPGHYTISFEEPWVHQISYKFVVGGQWRADPTNPKSESDGHGGSNSVRAVPGFHEDPLLTVRPGALELVTHTLELTDLEGSPRQLTVLAPADGRDSVTVYFQDGGDYLEQAGAAALLANLSSQPGLPAFTGVFIPPKDRMREYELLPAYADFVSHVVVPAVESHLPSTGGDRSRRLLIGASLGGLVTLYTALRSPEVFGNAASESGSLWFQDGALVSALGAKVSSPELRLRLYLDCGGYETPDMLKFNRLGAAAARESGQMSAYHEFPSTHSWVAWRNRLQAILRAFFSK